MVLKCYKMMIFCFYFFDLVFRFEMRCCGLRCGVAVCDAVLRCCGCGVAVAVLRFKGCGLVAVAVCGLIAVAVCGSRLRLRLRLGLITAFRGLVTTIKN